MNTTFDFRFSPGLHSRCGSPSSIMCTPWNTKRLRIALHRDDALAAQDVRALRLRELVEPRHELVGIDVAVEPHRDRLHVLVVIVLEAMMVMVGRDRGRDDRGRDHRATRNSGSMSRMRSRSNARRSSTSAIVDVALLRVMQLRVRVDRADARLDLAQFGRRHEIGLVEDDDVGEGDLVLGLGRVAQARREPLGVGDRHHRVEPRRLLHVLVDEEGLRDRARDRRGRSSRR